MSTTFYRSDVAARAYSARSTSRRKLTRVRYCRLQRTPRPRRRRRSSSCRDVLRTSVTSLVWKRLCRTSRVQKGGRLRCVRDARNRFVQCEFPCVSSTTQAHGAMFCVDIGNLHRMHAPNQILRNPVLEAKPRVLSSKESRRETLPRLLRARLPVHRGTRTRPP